MKMKKLVLVAVILVAGLSNSFAQEVKVITTIESIVPMGLGRSRIIDEAQPIDYKRFATKRSSKDVEDDGAKEEGGGEKEKRSDMKIDNFQETKLLNFYSGVGINFQNIASNDALISSKLNEMISQGWTLMFVTSGVESDAGKGDGKGIFITRYVFSRKNK
ncbi:hypothetical protein BH11BAC2_BH11BAC2_23350 [soil metagenome]